MRSTKQFHISLPEELAELVKAKVSAGEYATESDVITDGVRVLLDRDEKIESWLRTEVGQSYDALKKDPARARSLEQVRDRISAEHTGES